MQAHTPRRLIALTRSKVPIVVSTCCSSVTSHVMPSAGDRCRQVRGGSPDSILVDVGEHDGGAGLGEGPGGGQPHAGAGAGNRSRRLAFSHSNVWSVVEATNLGIVLILSAMAPSRLGQAPEKLS